MIHWQNDAELFALARRELFPAVVGDVMDKLGLLHQFLPPRIQPLHDDMVVIGRAMPLLVADVGMEGSGGESNPLLEQPFGLMLAALDDLKPGEIYLSTGGSPRYALWGELMSTRAIRLGAAGVVLDGYTRDTRGILALNFPTFACGRYAQDQNLRGKVVDFRLPIEIEEVRIRPGDLIFGDQDGVCVVPRDAEEEILEDALEKVRGEQKVREAIEAGMSASDAFAKFGIL
jgi:regulator of RNase E activity RraA